MVRFPFSSVAVLSIAISASVGAQSQPSSAPAESEQPGAGSLTLGAYIKSAIGISNRLRQAQIELQARQVDVARKGQRSSSELTADPSVAAHQYFSSPSNQAGVVFGVEGAWRHHTESGQQLSVSGHSSLPTSSSIGESSYGVRGEYKVPLWRNRFGRQFGMELQLEQARVRQAAADVVSTRLAICSEAIGRYIARYVAEHKLEVYRAVLKEKRRIWYQTAADYRKKMVPRLSLLSAKSDWLAAQARKPSFVVAVARADAALKEFYPVAADLRLAEPVGIKAAISDEKHDPRFRALDARSEALGKEQAVIVEQNRSDLDLGISLGMDRWQNRIAGPDVTDLWGMLGLRYVFPLKRPDVAFRLAQVRLATKQVEQERLLLRRQRAVQTRQAAASLEQAERAEVLVEKQIKASRQQIHAAYREFRAGKLQFQDFLDHWERYQAARLALWDVRSARWLAQRDALVAAGNLPPICK